MNRGGSRLPLILTAAAVLALVGVVAVASTGSTPLGSSQGRKPSDVVFDTFFSLSLLALLPAAALFVYGLLQRKEIAREIASGRYRRFGVVAYLVFFGLFTLAIYFGLRGQGPIFGGREEGTVIGGQHAVDAPEIDPRGETVYQAEFAWIPVLVVVALATMGVLAYVLAGRRRQADVGSPDAEVAEQLAGVLADTLEDLRAEPNPRRAVIAAYARLERALAASGLPRSGPETAQEYVTRVLDRLEADAHAVRRLTELFTQAKFSQHDVDEGMKLEAIEALVRIREDLGAAARRRHGARGPEPLEHGRAVAS